MAVFAVVVVYSFRSAVTDRTLQVGLHLILGGAIGNLVDRFFRLGYVVDFLDVYVNWGGQTHRWPRSTWPTRRSASASGCSTWSLKKSEPDSDEVTAAETAS